MNVALFPPAPPDDPSSYLALLAGALSRQGITVLSPAKLTVRWAAFGREVDVVHLHWLEFIAPSDPRRWAGLPRTLARATRLLLALCCLRARDIGVVWTVHNLEPHEAVRPRLERMLACAVARICDRAIVHSGYAARRFADRHRPSPKLTVIPHGNYVGVFREDPRSRSEVRRDLGLPDGAFVFLAFGQIRPYKRLLELVSSFEALDGDDVRLLIAGEARDQALAARLGTLASEDARVVLDVRRLPDDEVCGVHLAADAAVLAYNDVFSSGALLLALSYGLPIVAPAGSTATELVPPQGREAYAHAELTGALERMRLGDHEARRRSARQAAEECSWERVGEATGSVYAPLGARRRRGRGPAGARDRLHRIRRARL